MSDEIDDDAEDVMDGDFEGEEFDDDEPDEESVGDDIELADEGLDEFGETATNEDEADEEEEEASTPRARKVSDEEEEDEEEDPDDVEADLEAILRDRLASADDDDEDEGEEGTADRGGGDAASAPRGEEFVCPSCFLLVNSSQMTPGPEARCPHCGELLDI